VHTEVPRDHIVVCGKIEMIQHFQGASRRMQPRRGTRVYAREAKAALNVIRARLWAIQLSSHSRLLLSPVTTPVGARISQALPGKRFGCEQGMADPTNEEILGRKPLCWLAEFEVPPSWGAP
jgi:hypothetical protein